MENKKIKTIDWHIHLPMDFPTDWDDEMIEFYLNESSWCCDNLIDLLEEYSKENYRRELLIKKGLAAFATYYQSLWD